MSKPTNPVAIGAFVLGALALLVIGVFIFGGAKFFRSEKVEFVIFFDSSLNGLDVGAPVKMQGVKIGSVKEIVLLIDQNTGKVYKPVVVEIDRSTFATADGRVMPKGLMTHGEREENRDKLVDAGFRARLEMQSLLTGLLYIDLDIHKDQPPLYVGMDYEGLLEIPSIPTTTDMVKNTAEEVFRELRDLPLREIVTDLSATLKEIRDLFGSEEMDRSRVALAESLEETKRLMARLNRNLEPILKDTNKTVDQANALMLDSRALVEDFRAEIKPTLEATERVLTAATATLTQAQAAIGTMDGALGPDSALQQTLAGLRDAARSVKDLTDYLERHPEALISGKN